MDAFTRDDLCRLLDPHEPPCLSLFMPTHRRPPDAEQDPVSYRKLLDRARAEIERRYQWTAKELQEYFAPLEELDAPDFWVAHLDGLAVFRSRDCAAVYSVPLPLDEGLVVGAQFSLRPLLTLVAGDDRYFVLALSQGDVTLYEGNRYHLTALDIPALPADLQDAVGTEDVRDPAGFRSHPMGRNPMYAGHGTDPDDQDVDITRYFRMVERIVSGRLKDQTAPLVLAGPAEEWQLYRAMNTYPHLLDAALDGNHDRDTPDLLHERTWPLVAPIAEDRRRALLEQLPALLGTGRATANLSAIALAAVEGRVMALFLAEGVRLWGRYDRTAGRIEGTVTPAPSAGAPDDVLDALAEATLRRAGEVYTVPAAQLPGKGVAVAVYRY